MTEVFREKRETASQPSSSKTTSVLKNNFIASIRASISESMVEGFRHMSKSLSSFVAEVLLNAGNPSKRSHDDHLSESDSETKALQKVPRVANAMDNEFIELSVDLPFPVGSEMRKHREKSEKTVKSNFLGSMPLNTILMRHVHSILLMVGEGGAKNSSNPLCWWVKTAKYWIQKFQPGIFKAGRIKAYLLNWGKLTSDPHILNKVKGCKIEFDQLPPQRQPPCQHQLSHKEAKTISAEIEKSVLKGVLLGGHPCKNQTKKEYLWQGSKIQIVSIFAHK